MSLTPPPTGGPNVPTVLVPGNGEGSMIQGGTMTLDSASGIQYAPAVVQLADSAGTNVAGVDAHHNQYITDGGTAYVGITASSAGAVKTSAGRLCRVVVLTTVTSAVSIFDNTSAAAGQALLTIPASTAVGTIYNVQAPLTNGAYVGGGTGSPALLVTYC